jgi:hypothetical protein
MKEKISALIHSFILYDYILFGATFFLFLLFIILTIIVRRKKLLAGFLFLLSFSILILTPTLGYQKMHQYLFKNSVEIISQKRLQFTDAIVLKGRVTNESKKDFSSCKITAKVSQASKNKLRNFIYQFKIIQTSTLVKENISQNSSENFKMIIEPFTYKKRYSISLKADCK